MVDPCLVGLAGGSLLAPYYLYRRNLAKWITSEINRLNKKYTMLANSYEDRKSLSDVKKFLERAEKEFIIAKKRAMKEGTFIRKKYRLMMFNDWDNAHFYLSKLDPLDEGTHYKLTHLFEELGWEEKKEEE